MIDIKNLTNNGICSNCGECCSDILPLSTQEIVEIDKYLKTHKVERHNQSSEDTLNTLCPFRNQALKKCDIYEARPYICKMFKCDTQPEQAEWIRDEINKVRKPRSMTEMLFKDDIIVNALKEVGLKLYKRGE